MKGGECGWQGVCRAEGNKGGGEWDNCNNIINKIYFFKKEASNAQIKKNRNLWENNIKRSNIYIIGIPGIEIKKEEGGGRKYI